MAFVVSAIGCYMPCHSNCYALRALSWTSPDDRCVASQKACQWIRQMLGLKAYRLGVYTLYSHHGLYMEACASQNLAEFFPDEPHGSHPHLLSGRLTWKGLRLRHCSSHEDQQPFTEVKSALRAVPVCPFMSRLGTSLCSASHDRQCMISIW